MGGQVADLIVSAVVFQALVLGVCVATGLLKGWSLSAAASPLATAPLRADAYTVFPSLSRGGDVAARDGLLALFVALACAALILPLVVVTMQVTRAYLVPAAALGLAIADYLLSTKGFSPWWSVVSVGRELLEDTHSRVFMDSLRRSLGLLDGDHRLLLGHAARLGLPRCDPATQARLVMQVPAREGRLLRSRPSQRLTLV